MIVCDSQNFEPVPVPSSDHGKFFTGDSYIILTVSYDFHVKKKYLFLGIFSEMFEIHFMRLWIFNLFFILFACLRSDQRG